MKQTNKDGFKAYLMQHSAESFSKLVPIGADKTTIGRDASNSIQIANDTVSRNHAKITLKEGQYFIDDMGSSNGTLINDKPIKRSILNDQDIITFGNTKFIFLLAEYQANKLAVELDTDSEGKISINEDEFDTSDFYAQMAETMSFKLFNPPTTAEQTVPDSYKQAHERLALLYKMSEKFRSFDNIDQVLNAALELLANAIKAAEKSVIMLRMSPSEPLAVRAYNSRTVSNESETIPISQTVVNWVLLEGMAMFSPDIQDDRRFRDSKSVAIYNHISVICVPIKIKETVVGIIYIDSGTKFDPMNQEDLAFTAAVANELAVLIENHRLNRENIRKERIAAIGMTITDLAHNVKNLVNLNLNAVDLMDIHINEMNTEKIKKNWQYIRKGFEQINNLAIEMLDYAKDNKLDLKPIDINDLILSTKDYIAYNLVHEGIKLELKLDPSNPVWTVDKNQLQRAIINLVVNSIDAIEKKESGKIEIRTAVEENKNLIISINDNGCGIDSNQKNKIFYLFYTTKGSGGNGLGLPVVKKFVESLDGQLQVESNPGIGTTVSMIFPK